jgi:hypothetical protein
MNFSPSWLYSIILNSTKRYFMDPEDALIEKIQMNLTKNGFPNKTVAFPSEKIQKIIDQDGLELDMILSRLSMAGIYSSQQGDKLIFSSSPDTFSNDENDSSDGQGGLADLLGGLGDLLPPGLDPSAFAGKSKEDIMQMGKDLMANMSQEEQAEMFQKFMSMPADQREKLMGKAKDMNLF